jgi:flagellar M-ring protein FliF
MEVSIGQLISRLRAFWAGASRGLKLRLAVGCILGVGLVAAVVFFSQPSYGVLFANLAPADAGEISQRLDELAVRYKLGDDGRSILVARSEVYDLRNRLAMEGLPRGNAVGFEIFDQTKLGVTDFERRMQYIRALQGELSRTIGQMDGIRSAFVQVAMPEDRLYRQDQEPATASVLVDTVGQMSADKVRAIVHLVSHSVEGLSPNNITVVDTRGQVLSDLVQPEDSVTGLSASQLALQRSVEREIERNVQTMLEAVLGPGMVVTRAKAELNFDQREVTSEFFQPVGNDEGILRSIQELHKTFDSEGQPLEEGGITGNVITYPGSQGGGSSHLEERQITRNYEVNQITEHLVVAPGSVSHLSVSVVVNEELTSAQRQAIQAAVATAVGFRADRNDQITVTALPFQKAVQPGMISEAPPPRPSWQPMLIPAVAVIALLILLILVMTRRRRTEEEATVPLATELAAREAAPAREETMRDRIQRDVERLARQNPQEVAQLLATWLNE